MELENIVIRTGSTYSQKLENELMRLLKRTRLIPALFCKRLLTWKKFQEMVSSYLALEILGLYFKTVYVSSYIEGDTGYVQ